MILQSRIERLTNGVITIPWATSLTKLDSEWDLWLYSIQHPRDHFLSELVITPFNRMLWQDLWSIKMINRDVPGIIKRLGRLMQSNNINIVSMNSTTTDLGRYHASRIVVDCTKYKSPIDRDHEYRSSKADAVLNDLKREVIIEFIRELRFFNPHYPSIAIERILPLWRLYQESLGVDIRAFNIPMKIIDENLIIPKKELKRIEYSYSSFYQVSDELLGNPIALVSADEDLDLIRVFPFYRNFGIVSLSITTENRAGAIAAVGKSLSDAGFNVLASNAWTSSEQDRTSIWIVIKDLNIDQWPFDDSKVIERAKNVISMDVELQGYKPKVHDIQID